MSTPNESPAPSASPPACPVPANPAGGKCSATAGEQPTKKKPKAEAPATPSIPTSDALLSSRLRKELNAIWKAERAAAPSAQPSAATGAPTSSSTSSSSIAAVVPPFKVGTLEMYRRFPQAYDTLMRHHNCAAVQRVLLDDVLGRITESSLANAAGVAASSSSSSSEPVENAHAPSRPWVRVVDFGCGTGRIESMVVQHPAVQAVYAYDSETAMLRECLVNTVRSAVRCAHYSSVHLLPEASSGQTQVTQGAASSLLQSSAAPVELCADSMAEKEGEEEGKPTTQKEAVLRDLQLCLRPVRFQDVQDGFLASTHHPTCSLVVCAWSLSYVMRMQWGEDHWHAAVDAVVQAMIDHLDTSRSDAAIVILETLGNGSTEPTRQNTYTQRLEERFGFTRTWVRTDYEFADRADAERMARFFFGEKMLSRLTMDTDGPGCRLMECTGIWTLWRSRQSP